MQSFLFVNRNFLGLTMSVASRVGNALALRCEDETRFGGGSMRMISASRRYQRYFLISALWMLLIVNGVNAQDNEKAFAVVPESYRSQLIDRLKLYVDYQRSKDYERLYGLFSKATIDHVFKGQTLPQFVAAFRKGDEERTSVTILDFKVTKID